MESTETRQQLTDPGLSDGVLVDGCLNPESIVSYDSPILAQDYVGEDKSSFDPNESEYDVPLLGSTPRGSAEPKIWNILILGTGFMFAIGSLQTCVMTQTVLLNSVHDSWFDGSPTIGYICLAVSCATQAASYILGPILVAKTGPKIAVVMGGCCLVLYIACFIRPLTITLYIGSGIMGAGLGIVFLLQGYFLTVSSTKKTMNRNTGIFWTLYQASLIFGSLFYYFMLNGRTVIDTRTRSIVTYTLLGACTTGVVILSCLIHPWFGSYSQSSEDSQDKTLQLTSSQSATRMTVSLFKFAKKKEILILMPVFLYMGMEFSFWVNIYSTCLGYTSKFGIVRESLVGLNGVFIGIGEIIGGVILGFMGKWSHRNGKDPGMFIAMIIHLVSFYLIFLNLPAQSPLGLTDDNAFINPNGYLAMGCAFLLGIGDSIWNIQLMSFLGNVYPNDTVTTFAICQFWSSISGAAALLYSTVLILPYQLLFLGCISVPAAFGFFYEEWKNNEVSA